MIRMKDLEIVLLELLRENASEKELNWVLSRSSSSLPIAFVSAPRFTGKNNVKVNTLYALSSCLPDYDILWSLDRLCRVLFLIKIANSNEDSGLKIINDLFDTSEMNEAVALYTALPFLPFSEKWNFRATEAVRSNIGPVFDALAFENTFPATHFSELAWNQLVLKTIFNDKNIHRILGLNDRRNEALARSISDFAHERWAAGRNVPPLAWQLVKGFEDEQIISDIRKLLSSERQEDRIAASLVCRESTSERLKALLSPAVQSEISPDTSWKQLENL